MIPLEDLFRSPERAMVRLSPDGNRLAYLAPWNRRLNIHVQPVGGGDAVRVTDATERDIAGYFWASNERLVFVQDRGGDENYRLFAVDPDGANRLDLTPFDGVKCDLIDDLRDVDDEVLFQMNRRRPELFDAYRLNVRSGEIELLAENPGNVQSWISDHAGRLRLAVTTDGVNTELLHREDESSDWHSVARYDFKESASPQFFTPDNRDLYVASNVGRDRFAIALLDLADGREKEVLFEHPEVDVTQTMYSRERSRLTGALFETDRLHYHFFDDDRAALQRTIDEAMPGYENRIVSYSRDESRCVVHSGSDRQPGRYYLLEVERGQLQLLFAGAPWLDEERMAPVEPIRLKARDGLTLHGYLTRPLGSEGPVPLVVHPHGGPWHRDSWGFDPELQLLADRGYAVLQVNFRGSTGYGRRFWEASFGEWGLKMQDDVTDAVRWAIDAGHADPQRVAIYGGSYGGYATWAGVTKTPELYACGVSYVGVSNLFTWIESIPAYWKIYLEMLYEMVGHPERDAERFRATSPLFHVEQIRCPMLVAQGANDPRVPQHESDQIVAALRQKGLDLEYLLKEDEGHGFRNEENRFEFYRAMERFLARHLGGRFEAEAAASS